MEQLAHAPFVKDKHVKYFKRFLHLLPSRFSSLDSMRLATAFFAISGLELLDALGDFDDDFKRSVCDWLYRFQFVPGDEKMAECGFQGSDVLNIKSESGMSYCNESYVAGHLAMTYTGLATLVILGDDLSRIHKKGIMKGVKALQQEDGSFCATLLGPEKGMRFVYCAASICYILQDWSGMDVEKTVNYIKSSMSYDFGFGDAPLLESHGGMTYCSVAALTLMGKLHDALTEKQLEGLKRWAVFRQESGFQGRANKPPDTCYSFWVGATLKMLDLFDVVNFAENRRFIMTTQDAVSGGFAKWDDSFPDPLHTYLGLGGLSLMGEPGLIEINPSLNISNRAIEHLHNLHNTWKSALSSESGDGN